MAPPSAGEAGELMFGVWRATAWRRLASLVSSGLLRMSLCHGTTGRPGQEYRMP